MRVHTFNIEIETPYAAVYCGCGQWWQTMHATAAHKADSFIAEAAHQWEQHFQERLNPGATVPLGKTVDRTRDY